MLHHHYITFLTAWIAWLHRLMRTPTPRQRLCLDQLLTLHEDELPEWVRHHPLAISYLHLLRDLDWANFPERSTERAWPGPSPAPRAPFVAAFLVKIQEGKSSMGALRRFLVAHPALVWLLGFPLVPDDAFPWGFDVEKSLPCRQHFSRILRTLRPEQCRFLLDATVRLLNTELADVIQQEALPAFGDEISLDTKHILAWVKENNPKEYIKDRYDKQKQPKGDSDCKLGCKKKRNLPTHDGSDQAPTQEGLPASTLEVGDYYWGYASGIVVTKVGAWGEVVLAELTQTFDHSDQSYFFPLMAQTEARLGHRPRKGALDAAFDAFYVYDFFDQAGGFAAVPYAGRKDHRKQFNEEGAPLCQADLAMSRKSAFFKRANCLVPHECVRYACPLLFPEANAEACPINHHNWADGGCLTTIGASPGARIRHQLDRESPEYKRLYNQRTASERTNSQAIALGIERPKLRNACSIANYNTLIYVIINLRTLQRIRERKARRR